MSIKTFTAGERLTAQDLNDQYNKILEETGQNSIQALQDRAITYSANGGRFVEAYTDSNGRNNSVDTGASTTATSLTNSYAPIITDGTLEGTGFTTFTTFSNNILTDVVIVNAGYFSKLSGLVAGGSGPATLTFNVKSGTDIIATKSVVASVAGTFGVTFTASDYSRMLLPSETITLQTTSNQGIRHYYKASQSFSGTNFTITSQDVLVDGTGNEYEFIPVTTTAGEITHTIPSGTFDTTLSNAFVTYKAEDWEAGADVQFKLTNATEDTGWLNTNETVSFTALTAEPDNLIVKLIPKVATPTAGYPSLNGVCLYAGKP